MKNFLILFTLLLLCSFQPAASEPVKISVGLILAVLTGIWEVIGRLIPSAGQITVIGKVLEVLTWLSNFFNRKSK